VGITSSGRWVIGDSRWWPARFPARVVPLSWSLLIFLFLPFRLQVAEQVFGELGYVRGEAGRGEVESEGYAYRGMPCFQSCIFT
jgi:hypothetical protein